MLVLLGIPTYFRAMTPVGGCLAVWSASVLLDTLTARPALNPDMSVRQPPMHGLPADLGQKSKRWRNFLLSLRFDGGMVLSVIEVILQWVLVKRVSTTGNGDLSSVLPNLGTIPLVGGMQVSVALNFVLATGFVRECRRAARPPRLTGAVHVLSFVQTADYRAHLESEMETLEEAEADKDIDVLLSGHTLPQQAKVD